MSKYSKNKPTYHFKNGSDRFNAKRKPLRLPHCTVNNNKIHLFNTDYSYSDNGSIVGSDKENALICKEDEGRAQKMSHRLNKDGRYYL